MYLPHPDFIPSFLKPLSAAQARAATLFVHCFHVTQLIPLVRFDLISFSKEKFWSGSFLYNYQINHVILSSYFPSLSSERVFIKFPHQTYVPSGNDIKTCFSYIYKSPWLASDWPHQYSWDKGIRWWEISVSTATFLLSSCDHPSGCSDISHTPGNQQKPTPWKTSPVHSQKNLGEQLCKGIEIYMTLNKNYIVEGKNI